MSFSRLAASLPRGVLRGLLYCHGLVLEDPVAIAAEMARASPAEVREPARRALVAAATNGAGTIEAGAAGPTGSDDVAPVDMDPPTWNRTTGAR